MINAYAIGVSATLEDNVTSRLMSIVEWGDKANASMLEFAETMRKMSGAGAGLARNLDKSAAAATALGDSSAGLTRASYVLDTMAASSGDLARNMAAARAEGRGMGAGMVPVPGGSGGGSNRNTDVVAGGGNTGSGSAHIGTAAGVAAGGMLYGIYENARLNDENVKAVATDQVEAGKWASAAADLRKREMEYASQYAWATGGEIKPFGETILEASRLLRTLTPEKQILMLDTAMPYMAAESKLKDVPLAEAAQAFIGLAHQAGAYDPKQAAPLFEAMMQASLTTHASLNQISRAASYSLPALHAAGANATDVMLLVATMMQGGIMNTKSGTWLNAMAGNTLPNTLGSGLFSNKKQNEALEDLGLYRKGRSQFYAHGTMDLMKIVSILAEDRQKIDPLKFNAMLKMAFGTQGQRAASFFSEDTTLQNLQALSALKDTAIAPLELGKKISELSSIAKADQTIANANMTLMNGTATFMNPVNNVLDSTSKFFKGTADFTEKHPVAGAGLDAGMLFGAAVAGLGAWSGAKGAAGLLEKGVVGLSKYIGRGAGVLLGRAIAGTAIADIGAGALAAAGGELAVGAVIASGIAYALAAGLKWAMDKIPTAPAPEGWTPKGISPTAAHGSTSGHPSNAHSPPVIQNHFYVDSQEVATKLIPGYTLGPSGFNASAAPLRPSMAASN